MYTVVLMVAVTGGAQAPEHGRHGCHGCSGTYACSGVTYSGCTGVVHSGCTGVVYSGCTGVSYCSGYSSCHGCRGGHGLFGRHRHGCNGCSGYVACTGYSGCTGYYGCAGGVIVPSTGGTTAPPTGTQPKTDPKTEPKTDPKKTSSDSSASIRVTLPAGATLLVDGTAVGGTSTERVLVSPPLNSGMVFYYTLRAEFARDGQTVAESQTVAVRAGQVSQAAFGATQNSFVSVR